MRRALSLGAVVVLSGLAFSGCLVVDPPSAHMGGVGTDGGGRDSGLLPVPATQFCARLADVACQGYENCCTTHSATMAQCTSSLAMMCSMQIGPLLTDARTGYDENVAAEVLAEGQAFVSLCMPDIVAWYRSRRGIQRVFQGTVRGGDPCSTSASDIPAYFSCRDFSQGCIGSGSTFNCSARRTDTQPCFIAPDCIETDYCMGGLPLVGIPGHCAPREAVGAMCTGDGDCQTYLCDPAAPHHCAALNQQSAYCGLH